MRIIRDAEEYLPLLRETLERALITADTLGLPSPASSSSSAAAARAAVGA